MKFLKIAMTLILSASVISLVSAPEAKKVETEFLTISTPMIITVER